MTARSTRRAPQLGDDREVDEKGSAARRLWFHFRSHRELRREDAKLQEEINRLRGYESTVKTTGSLAARLITGSELQESFRSWVRRARGANSARDLVGDKVADLGAVLRRVVRFGMISDANLNGSNLSDANLKDIDLTGAKGLTLGQIKVAYGNERTELRSGLKRPEQW